MTSGAMYSAAEEHPTTEADGWEELPKKERMGQPENSGAEQRNAKKRGRKESRTFRAHK